VEPFIETGNILHHLLPLRLHFKFKKIQQQSPIRPTFKTPMAEDWSGKEKKRKE